jgi:hypothetical protein
MNGSEIQFTLNLQGDQGSYQKFLNQLWEESVFDVISGNFTHADDIAGIRIVDKSKGENLILRMEIWLKIR